MADHGLALGVVVELGQDSDHVAPHQAVEPTEALDADRDPRPLSGRAVALIVKRAVEAVSLPPEDFAGHSLRAGFVSQAALMGADSHAIRRQTDHRLPAIFDRYVWLAVGTSGLKLL